MRVLASASDANCPVLKVTGVSSIIDKSFPSIEARGAEYEDATDIPLDPNDATKGSIDITAKDMLLNAVILDGVKDMKSWIALRSVTRWFSSTRCRDISSARQSRLPFGVQHRDTHVIAGDAEITITGVKDELDTVEITAPLVKTTQSMMSSRSETPPSL